MNICGIHLLLLLVIMDDTTVIFLTNFIFIPSCCTTSLLLYWQVPYEVVGRRQGDIDTLYADPALALRELNWKANKGLKEMCKWLAASAAHIFIILVQYQQFMVYFSIAAHSPSSSTIWRRTAQRSWRYHNLKNKDRCNTSRMLLARLKCARLNIPHVFYIKCW